MGRRDHTGVVKNLTEVYGKGRFPRLPHCGCACLRGEGRGRKGTRAGRGSGCHSGHGRREVVFPPSVNQGQRLRTTTAPSPDGTAAGRRTTTVVYDAFGRVVASKVGGGPWTCTTYDGRGRVTSVAIPAYQSTPPYPGEPARTSTYDYRVGGNPLVSTVAEGSATITTKVDLLGRVISYTDVWGKTTTSTYHQAGWRTETNGPGGAFRVSYHPDGRVKTQSLDGALMATPGYDAAGELSSVSYATAIGGANGTALSAVARHPTGMITGLTWTGPTGAVASDLVERSQSGKVVNETIDGVDADPAQPNFTYDAAGRLDLARVPGRTLDYIFASSGGCGASPKAGRNTNRTAVIDNGGTPTTYCYDRADRLTSSSDAAVGTPAYDAHGNTTTLGNQRPIYDGADRHMETRVNDATVVRYGRDATGRIVSRTEGSTTVRYGFAGAGDSPSFTMDAQSNVIERTVALVGGVLVTKRGGLLGAGDVWSYPNVHGDVMATADHLGNKQGATISYDPFGKPLGGIPDNSAGNFDYGWLGQHQRPLEHAGSLVTIEMGARQYVPGIGRFLEVDPVEGGCANDYVYVFGDPVNDSDLDGMGVREWVRERARNVKNIGRGAWNAVSRNVFTCADTTFTRAAGALSLVPPFGRGGSKRAWTGNAAGWLNFTISLLVGHAASGNLGRPPLAGLAGTTVRAGSRISTAVAVAASVYDFIRRLACRNR